MRITEVIFKTTGKWHEQYKNDNSNRKKLRLKLRYNNKVLRFHKFSLISRKKIIVRNIYFLSVRYKSVFKKKS